MLKELLTLIPAKYRKLLYVVVALGVLVCGAAGAYCAAVGVALPAIFVGLKAVLLYLGGAAGIVASVHLTR